MRKPELRNHAKERQQLHRDHPSSTPYSKDYEFIGLLGERAFVTWCAKHGKDIKQDLKLKANGDKGRDFVLSDGATLDVKTARIPAGLIVEQGKVDADIYVLALYHETAETATLLGWQSGEYVKAQPCRTHGYEKISHHVKSSELKPMDELVALL